VTFDVHDQFQLVDDAPLARDAARKEQRPAQIAQVENHTADPHAAILRLDADVIGRDLRIILQGLDHLRRQCFIRRSTRCDDDFLQCRRVVTLRLGRLSHGKRPARQNGHSQRCRQEWAARTGPKDCHTSAQSSSLTHLAQNLKLIPVETPSSWQPPQVVGPALL